jgi:hypothetical protein
VPASRSSRSITALAGALVALGLVGSVAVALTISNASPATVTRQAERVVRPVAGTVVLFDYGAVDQEVIDGGARAAEHAGGHATVSRTGALGMVSVRRGGAVVHAAPDGYLIPTVFVAAPATRIGALFGANVASQVGPTQVVMNTETAALTGAVVGDTIVMQAADGRHVPLSITALATPDEIGSAELVLTDDAAERLGATEDTRVVLYGVDRNTIERALADEGLIGRPDTKVVRSWDAPDPDSTLSTIATKQLLGEPWYRFEDDGSISMHPTWMATNLTDGRVLLNATIPIRARCHVEILDDLKAALAEVAAAGLAGAIEVANANTYGGCYGGARFSRMSGQIGFLSRHSYGMALDTNTRSNCQGCVPKMDCDVVRIFRRHGFAWGGNFRRPDGMHFEWVGERRDDISYPSHYCPNAVNGTIQSVPGGSTIGLDVLTANAETPVESDHG